MKKVVGCILLMIALFPLNVSAQRGCCSWHGGVSGTCRNGYQVCNDGTTSPSCTCSGSTGDSSSSSTKKVYITSYIYGCTDRNALNYNPKANRDDGSCIAKILGCMDKNAKNYNQNANTSDNSCQYEKEITETKTIKYSTKYIDNDEMINGEEKIKTPGSNGEKEVVYTILVDANGKELSREKQSETVTKEATNQIVEKGTKENSSAGFAILWIICIITVFYQAFKYKEGNLLLNKIQKQNKVLALFLYIIYISFVLPVFIDIIIIIINKIKHLNHKNKKEN